MEPQQSHWYVLLMLQFWINVFISQIRLYYSSIKVNASSSSALLTIFLKASIKVVFTISVFITKGNIELIKFGRS